MSRLTLKGLYRPSRLPFRVSSASAIFQSKIEQVLQGIPMVVCRVDDILISGKNDREHLDHLNEVLSRLESAGLRLKLSKCKFMQPTVEYLGYRIDVHGLHAIEKKVEAIRNVPAPENQQQLRSFLGMINYYSKFISNYSTITHPLNELLKDGVKWSWSKEQQRAFNELKEKLLSTPVLIHFRDTAQTRHRCFTIWNRSRDLACSSIGRRTSHCICFTHIEQKRAKLCANRERSAQHNFRN